MPAQAEAGLLSSLFGVGDQAYAENNVDTLKPIQSNDNCQNLVLLKANVSSFSIFQEKNDKKEVGDIIGQNTNIVSDNALVPATGPMGVSDGKDVVEPSLEEMSVYVVRKGDTISQIATMFDVSANTIRWANDIKAGEKLGEGDVLIILPVSGVKHIILKGQTLNTIAKLYKVDVSDITDFNQISDSIKLVPGDELIIPGAEIVSEVIEKPKTTKEVITKKPLLILGGYFINPVPEYKRKSQGYHGNNSVDLAAPTGTPILAAASGKVIFARKGNNGGYGNLVIISHPNGTETLYAHQSKIATQVGAQVYQGQIIGYVGSTGHSTGPHLHYEVHGARNNCLDL